MGNDSLIEEGLQLEDRVSLLRADYILLVKLINGSPLSAGESEEAKLSLARLKDYAKLGAEALHLYQRIPTRQLQLIDTPAEYYLGKGRTFRTGRTGGG